MTALLEKVALNIKNMPASVLETQFFPNAMKHKNFPSPVLKAGSLYSYTTEYRFSVENKGIKIIKDRRTSSVLLFLIISFGFRRKPEN